MDTINWNLVLIISGLIDIGIAIKQGYKGYIGGLILCMFTGILGVAWGLINILV